MRICEVLKSNIGDDVDFCRLKNSMRLHNSKFIFDCDEQEVLVPELAFAERQQLGSNLG